MSEHFSPKAFHWEPKFPFDLAVAYEDGVTRGRALKLYEDLVRQLLDDYDFRCTWWKFDHLCDPNLLEQAVDAASGADMVILSLHSGKELPLAARTWIEKWSSGRGNQKSALVILMDLAGQRSSITCRLQTYLQQVARCANMDFFFHALDVQRQEGEYSVEQIIERAQAVTPVIEEILHNKTPIPRIQLN